jgi:hypothetical protein
MELANTKQQAILFSTIKFIFKYMTFFKAMLKVVSILLDDLKQNHLNRLMEIIDLCFYLLLIINSMIRAYICIFSTNSSCENYFEFIATRLLH